MTVVLDARVCTEHFPGIGRYASALARCFPEIAPDLDLTLLEYDGPGRREVHAPRVPRIYSGASPFSLKQQWEVPRLLRACRAALYHSTYYLMPYRPPAPTVVTLHDFIPYLFPQYYSRARRAAIHAATNLAIRRADAIIAISQTTRSDLCRILGVKPERVRVTPLAADPFFAPASPEEILDLRRRYQLPEQYVLYVGSNKPHKNLVSLIEAFALLAREPARGDLRLLIVGTWDPRYPEARARVSELGLESRVRLASGASDELLRAHYVAASVFVMPSMYEGYGSPLMEAMASGAPSVCGPALAETAGDAATIVEVNDADEVARTLARILDSPELRNGMRERGIAHARQFSYARTARETLDIYRQLVGESALLRHPLVEGQTIP